MGNRDRSVAVTTRLKREECRRTKHDSAFSDWKILIGPNDWVDHLLGKEGAEKYRTQNLPNSASCPGVYELGIAVSRRQSGREASRLDPNFIVPVYVGKSDNVRTRLQRYGREGAHLENRSSNIEVTVNENVVTSKRAGLFTEAFSRGFSIVYRWAPMNDKKDAEKTEARLLEHFDYAWNKGSNGVRRHNDVLCKLDGISSATRLPAFIRKLEMSLEKRKGIRIQVCDPISLENGSDSHHSFKSTSFLPQIFKIARSHPRVVSVRFGVNGDLSAICGVALGHGSVCIRPPIVGNKRCAEHKGMKINGISKLIADGNSSGTNDSTRPCAGRAEDYAPICGFILDDGAPCARKPFHKNKRCLEHKGRRRQVTDKNGQIATPSSDHEKMSSTADTKHTQDFCGSLIHQNHSVMCGVNLHHGMYRTRQPANGSKRCEEYEGLTIEEVPSLIACPTTQTSNGRWNIDIPAVSHPLTCGATLRNGCFCKRRPSEGNERCWQHKGMKS